MKKFIEFFVGLLVAVEVLCLAVVLALNLSFVFKRSIKKYDLIETTGLSRTEILQNYNTLIDYNNLGGPKELEFPNFPMSEGGRIHFQEVRAIFHGIEITTLINGAVVLILVKILNKIKWFGYRMWGSMLCLAIPFVIGISVLFFWDSFFVKFHEIVFHNDYWLFSPTEDPVITILPEGYFKDSAILIVELCIAGAVLLAYTYRTVKPRTPEEQEYVERQEKIQAERRKKFEEEEAKRKDLKKGKRLGKHDFNLAEKANIKTKNL